MNLSIRWKLIGSYVLLALFIVGVLGLLLSAILSRSFELSERQALEQNAAVIARQAGLLWQPEPDLYRLRMLLENYGALSQARLTILDRHQRPIIDVQPASRYWASVEHGGEAGTHIYYYVAQLQDGPPILRFSRGQPPATGVWVYVAHSPLVSGFFFTEGPGPQQGAAGAATQAPPDVSPLQAIAPIAGPHGIEGYVRISEMASYRSQILASVRRAFLWASMVAVLLGAGAGLYMSRRLSRPLGLLAWATGRMAAGDLAVRAPVHQRDEIGALASSFNEMAARLQQSFQALAADRDQLRRFVADVSHELRTPITALSTFIELLQSSDDDAVARAEFLAESAAQVERLDRLTVNLLQLSRLDAGLLPMERSAEDVGDLLLRTRGRWAARAAERPVALRLELPGEPLGVACDRLRIEQVLDNLVGNAIKFVPAGGEITVGARACPDGGVEFWVADSGPGIAPDDLPHITDRFYRGQGAGHSDGSGLGLAIARAILTAHGSDLQVESEVGQGSRFSFVLPPA